MSDSTADDCTDLPLISTAETDDASKAVAWLAGGVLVAIGVVVWLVVRWFGVATT